jgi:peptidoglycan/xylan/chitin deacetylase (PgdA/CDA1 family)
MATISPLVICYHSVSSGWPNPTAVSPDVVAKQLSLLRARGYVGFTLRDLIANLDAGTLPGRAVAITFDDGYASTLRAKPILDAFNYPATVFAVTGFVDSGSLLRWPGIDQWHRGEYADELQSLRWTDLEALIESGWEVGSHTRTHAFLPHLARNELESEIAGSREDLIRRVGRCDTFAYPYGAATAEAAQLVSASGYSAACVVTPGPDATGIYSITRVGLYGRDTGLRLRAKLSPRLYALALRRRTTRAAEPAELAAALEPMAADPDRRT